jgi:hypothetical protein
MSHKPIKTAQQGHRYNLHGQPVIALQSGVTVKVLHFDDQKPWIGWTEHVPAVLLVPQPMKYFSGQTPL